VAAVNNSSSSDSDKDSDDIWSDEHAAQFAAYERKKRKEKNSN
jgi:hypothetical protein